MDARELGIAVLLGVVAFVSTVFLPTPVDKMFLVVQALAFATGSLSVDRGGATLVSLTNGVLLSLMRSWLFPFSLVFSLIYGLLIDSFFQVLGVRRHNSVAGSRLVVALVLATALTGVLSMYLTVSLNWMPSTPLLYCFILVGGVINGAVASYLTLLVWKRYLSHVTL